MKIQTVNQLISVFKDISTRHYQINGFGIGDNWENGASEAKMHPVLWINPTTATMPSTDNGYKTFEIDFEVRVFDLVNKDESNENEVLSDCIDILKDIITEFKGHPYYVNSQLNIIDDISFEAFTEEFDEEVSGWVCEISLMTPILTSFCGIPSADITGFEFPGIDCPDVNVLCPVFVEDVTGVYPIVVNTIGTTKEISIVGGATDTFVISGEYDNGTLTLTRNDDVDVVVTGFENDYTTAATLSGNIITFDRTDTAAAYSVDLTTAINSAPDKFVQSGAFDNSNKLLTLTLNDLTNVDIDLSSLTTTDKFVESGAYDEPNEKIVLTLNDASTVDIDTSAISGGGGGASIYTANDTIGAGRVATLTDSLTFSEGTFDLLGLDKDNKVAYVSGDSSFGGLNTYVSNALNFKYDTNNGTGQLWAINNGGFNGKINIKGSEVLIENIKTNDNLILSGNSVSVNAQRAIEVPFGTTGAWKGVNLLATQVGGGGANFEMQVSPAGLGGTYETALKIAKDKTISLLGSATIQGQGTSTGSALSIYNNDTTPVKLWDFLDNGDINLGVDSVLNIGTKDLDFSLTTGVFSVSKSLQKVNTNFSIHTALSLDNGTTGGVWSFTSANASTTFNQDEFAISNGSNTPIRINNITSVALGNVGKVDIDTSYNVQTAGATLIGGNLDTKSGSNEISLDHTNYPKLKISNGTQEYWLIEGDGTGSAFASGEMYLYDATNGRKLIHFLSDGNIDFPNIPTSAPTKGIWNDGGTVKIA